MRVPSHLREYVRDFDLETWVDEECGLKTHYATVELLEARLLQAHHAPGNEKVRDTALVALIAICLDEEMLLEDHVIDKALAGYDFSKEGSMVPVCQAAGWLILRKYRKACADGHWPEAEPGGAD
jgi:hypothetical protein